jgi:hypothetical protein
MIVEDKMQKKIDRIREQLQNELPLIFTDRVYKIKVLNLHNEGAVGLSTKRTLYHDAKE